MYLLPKILKKYSFVFTFIVVIASIIIGSQVSKVLSYPLAQVNNVTNYQLGQELYVQNCSGCHIPIPAEVLPTDTWQEILEKPGKHYSTALPKLSSINTRLIWSYLKTYSRPSLERELKPEFVTQSRYFKALHPQVDLPKPVTHQSCILCHPGAKKLDYISLSSEFD